MHFPTIHNRVPIVALLVLCVCLQASWASASGVRAEGKSLTSSSPEGPVIVTVSFTSIGLQDGWILESSETSGKGGTKNNLQNGLRIGDNALNRQYRSVLSFRTAPVLPDTAVITSVRLSFRRQLFKGATDPISLHQGIMVDLIKGTLGLPALQLWDFQAMGAAGSHMTFGPFKPAGNTVGWYSIALPAGAGSYINKLDSSSGLTQLRLRFKLDDDNNFRDNYLSIFSGDAPAGSLPKLIVKYYLP